MRKILLLIALSCISCNVFAQVDVEGYVLLYNNKSQGVPGVIVTRGNDGTTTDNKGYFKVQFSGEFDRRQGSLKIEPPSTGEYKNYIVMEVDGFHYVDVANITIGRIDPIKISLCSPTSFKEIVLKLAKPYLDEALATKNRQINDLLKANNTLRLSNDELNKRLQFIENEYVIAESNYLELAEKFARINPEFADDNLRKAREYFEQGDIENAKKCLPSYELAKSDVARGKTVMSLHLSIIKTEGSINEVRQKYDDILEHTGIPNERFKLLVECSEYLFQNRIFDNLLVGIALEYAKEANSLYRLSLSNEIYSYNLLGKIQKEQMISDYFKNYKTAIDIFSNQPNNSGARKNIAVSYIEYANYYKEAQKIQQAIRNYRKAMDIYIEMYNHEEYDDVNYLNMLINLAACYVEKRNNALVNQCKDRIEMLSRGIDMTFEDSVRIYTALGTFNLTDNEYGKALSYYKSAYNLCVKKEQSTPLYKNTTIKIGFLVGLAYNYNEDFRESIRFCENAESRIGEKYSENQLVLGYIYALKANSYKHLGENKNNKNYIFKANSIAKISKDKDLADFINYAKHEKLYIYIGDKKFNIQSTLWFTLLGLGSLTMII